MMQNSQDHQSLQSLDESRLRTLDDAVAAIIRVLTCLSVGLGVGATIGGIAYLIIGGTVEFVLPGMGTVIGAIVGGVAGALLLAIDALKRNKSQSSSPLL